MLLLRRPILVWIIFAYSLYVAVLATWALLHLSPAMQDEYGSVGLVISMVPATVLLLSGLSLFLLTRLAVWMVGLNALLTASFIYTGPSIRSVVWFGVALAALAYAIWLRRAGILR